jgi:hypothetical protein
MRPAGVAEPSRRIPVPGHSVVAELRNIGILVLGLIIVLVVLARIIA